MRQRMASESQYEEEFHIFDEDMRRIWFEAKDIYSSNMVEIDLYLAANNTLSTKAFECFIAMKRVVNDEIDDILLGLERVRDDKEQS